ncbi:hypothetical protein QSJ19_04765 [Gordonia sp. ABSL11-1]|uniref:hypothetical protein n=1 Tax=Gordonia sp. ABSL11-1 TaxID=3053924 RepID=UPI002573363C|nr:hypothetical protein [Gordonia sp. ABSL11-1]MDL9944907.1 hypothetical protein [Gordonia sp. ABSL11-1]
MRVSDHPTQPIVPSVTEEIRRWPAGDSGTPIVEYQAPEVSSGVIVPEAAAVSHASGRFSTPPMVHPAITRRDVEDRPIPAAVPEVWEYAIPYTSPRLPVTASVVAGPITTMSSRPRESSGMATAALVTGVVSLPLALIGVGAVLGFIAMVLAATALVRIGTSRNAVTGSTRHRGTGRAIASLVLGTGSIVVGAPILLVILAIAAIL